MNEHKTCKHLWVKVKIVVDHKNYVVKKCFYCNVYNDEYERDTKKVYYGGK